MKTFLQFLSKFDVKTLFFSGVIALLFILLMIERCKSIPECPPVKTDTIVEWKYIHDTIPGKPVIIHEKGDTIWQQYPGYIPDSTYQGLLRQYRSLGYKFFEENTFETSFYVDSLGWCYVYDTVTQNSLIGNKLITDFKIPTITKIITKTVTTPSKRQIYIGGGIKGNTKDLINGIEGGLLYKDKKDRIFGINAGYISGIGMEYSLQSYWKIKLKK